jgi:hypothetical protein
MVKLNKNYILDILEQNADTIRNLGVKKLYLFGSYARDEQKSNSDIDFLVEFEKGRGLFDDYMGLSVFLEELFGKKVDLVKPHLVREELKPYILNGKKYEARV